MINIKNLSFKYQDETIIENLNLKIDSEQSIAFMGANGCGKTTLFKILSGLLFANSGEYKFQNEVINQDTMEDFKFSKKFHRKVGFVFQNSSNQLFCSNVFDEIAFGARQLGLDENDVKIRVDECLNILDIQKLRDKTPFLLSGGEKKKVAIASILITNPSVILFDEPLAALDCKSQRELIDILKELLKSQKTLIFATHNLNFAKEISNRIILLGKNTKILADDKSENIVNDVEILKSANVIDPFYHLHGNFGHIHESEANHTHVN